MEKIKDSDSREPEDRPLIIAVDFDGTLTMNDISPEIGEPRTDLITRLIDEQAKGAKIILWTCRCGEYLDSAVSWCRSQGLYFDAVNDNLQLVKDWFGNDCRKVFADVYFDDKFRDFTLPF